MRNEIVHHGSEGIDERFAGQYLACCLNYESNRSTVFGEQHSLGDAMVVTLSFRDLFLPRDPHEKKHPLPGNVARFVQDFDASTPDEIGESQHFKCRLLFTPLITNKNAQADRVIEFVPADSELSKTINKAHRSQVVVKETERPKYLPSDVVKLMTREGYAKFNMRHHTTLWKDEDAKNPGRGFGVQVGKQWYWYDRWVERVRDHCEVDRAVWSCPAFTDGWLLGLMVSDVDSSKLPQSGERGNRRPGRGELDGEARSASLVPAPQVRFRPHG